MSPENILLGHVWDKCGLFPWWRTIHLLMAGRYVSISPMRWSSIIAVTAKRVLFLLLMLAGLGSGREDLWTLRMPETSILPSYAKASYIGRMSERHGGSHLGLQDYTVNVPFADGRRSHVGKWFYNVQANISATIMDVGGELDLRRDELLSVALPISVIRPLENGKRLMFTAMPRYVGDTVSSAHAWDMVLVAEYSVKASETLSYSVGLAASPRFADYVVVPYIAFRWQPVPDWMVRMRGYQLAALYKVNERLRVGPAISNEGGAWMVSTPRGQRIFRVRSLALAGLAEYDFSVPGKSKRMLNLAVGATVATTAEFCRRSLGRDVEEPRHYHPGFYLAGEVDFRF